VGRRSTSDRGEAAQGHDALVEVARFALTKDQRGLAFDILRQVLNQDTYHAAAIELSTPFTRAYRQKRPLAWPLRGRWRANGDRTRHHQRKAWARYALDLFKVNAEGKTYSGDGRKLTDHFGYGAPFYAVADGRVVEVRDGFPDNEVDAKVDDALEKHNGVVIDHGADERSWYVHAKAGTMTVKVGDQVKRGQLLGQVGNSGASGTPHLHFTLIAWGNLSVPWACDDYVMIAPDGTPIPVTRACPREGWTIESKESE
jgi:murein DD-endopeptidase MepM/ murein hydrolase activator NlpD